MLLTQFCGLLCGILSTGSARSIHLVLIWMSAHVCHFQVSLLLGSTHFFRSCSLLQAIQVLMSWPSWQSKTLQKCWPLGPLWIGSPSRHWRNWAVSSKRCVCYGQLTMKQIVEDIFINVNPAPVTNFTWNFIHDLCQRQSLVLMEMSNVL